MIFDDETESTGHITQNAIINAIAKPVLMAVSNGYIEFVDE